MSLQYPGSEFVDESIKSVTGLDINDYKEKKIFLQLDTGISEYPFQLFMKVLKMRDVPYVSDEVQMAAHSRNKVLPAILKT